MTTRRIGRWIGLAALAAALCAPALLAADEIPSWPHEQQARLREVEGQVLDVQRKLFAARQQRDDASVATLSEEFRKLQKERRELIRITANQLPSE
jgi:hypothetical protein